MLLYRLVYGLVAKVDCIRSWKSEGGYCILRWSSASRINFRLKRLLQAAIIFQQDGACTRAYCSSRARMAQCHLPWFHWEGPMAPKLSGFEPAGLSRVGSYAGEIPQSPTKAKNDQENWRLHWSWYGKIYLWNPSTRPSKTLQRDSEHVWVLVVDTLNTSCEAISRLFNNNYLRCDLKNRFCYFCCVTCFWTIKKQRVDSLKVI
jgi:hypothetical protein